LGPEEQPLGVGEVVVVEASEVFAKAAVRGGPLSEELLFGPQADEEFEYQRGTREGTEEGNRL